MDNVLHRIEYLLASYNDKRSLHVRFAEYAGIDEQHASQIVTGEKPLTAELIGTLQRRHRVSADWLIGEKGKPWLPCETDDGLLDKVMTALKSHSSLARYIYMILGLEKQLDEAAASGKLPHEMRHLAAVAEAKDGIFDELIKDKHIEMINGVRRIIQDTLARYAVKHNISPDQYTGTAAQIDPTRATNALNRLENKE